MNKLGRGLLDDATYQISIALDRVVLDKKIFSCVFFYHISLCKTYDPRVGAIFGLEGHDLHKHGRCLPRDVTYQISRLKAIWFQTRTFFHVFTI